MSSSPCPPPCSPIQLCWAYSGSALSNYAAGIKAWHLLHDRMWLISINKLKAILDRAKACAPESSKQPKHLLFIPNILASIHEHLNLNKPLDAAVYACLTTMFYCIVRLDKFTVTAVQSFNPNKHILRRGVSEVTDCHGHPIMKFHIPSTKTAPIASEDTLGAEQDGPTDPKAVLLNHFWVNSVSDNSHLFSWEHPKVLDHYQRKN